MSSRMLFVDCRPRAAYEAGHLPGALHADPELDLTTHGPDPTLGGRHPLPDADRLAEVFGALGVDGDTFVLAYDEGDGWAARCWWLLRHVGHDAAGTFDVRTYQGPREAGAPPAVTATAFVSRPRSDDTITAGELRGRLGDTGLLVLDARSLPRWHGDEEPLDPVAGRIPGSRNAFYREPLPADLPNTAEVAAYCGSGVTACVVVQRLVAAGRDDARLYPGSFSEWCRNPDNPIERGPA